LEDPPDSFFRHADDSSPGVVVQVTYYADSERLKDQATRYIQLHDVNVLIGVSVEDAVEHPTCALRAFATYLRVWVAQGGASQRQANLIVDRVCFSNLFGRVV